MQLAHAQRGLGMWGWLVVLSVIGFFAMVGLQLTPLYLNEMKVYRVVQATAKDPSAQQMQLPELRHAMQTRWDVEDIDLVKPSDIKLVTTMGGGKALAYDYEARAPLVYNIYVLVHFQHKFAMSSAGGND
ncbi:MAG TPA: DUF4845 domain-containing protein [Candidatus Binatia bacterium]|nr:DUF4845 domain-containing protein [Candidatus Binatia bacterium]